MKKFLLLIFQLLATLLFLNILLYLFTNNSENSRFYNYYKIIKQIKAGSQYKYVVTGDSHADSFWWEDNDEKILDLSFPGDNQIDIQRKISFLKKNNISYETHLYEIDPQVLSTYRNSANNNDLSLSFNNSIKSIKLRTYLPLFFNPRAWTDIKNKFLPPAEEEVLTDIDTSGMNKRADTQFLSQDFSTKMQESFHDNITKTKEQKADIIFIHYPFYHGYIKLIEESETYQDAMNEVSQLATKNNIAIIDMSNVICNTQNLYNQDHVNDKGAEIGRVYLNKALISSNFNIDGCID